jgi:type III pantothenate kinase
VNAVAALKLVAPPLIVVDFGTATTFDAVDRGPAYVGGVIAPGIGISAEALFLRASRLPRIEIHKPETAVGTSTVGSMQSGLYYGYIGLVDGIIERMKSELGEARVIATGGLAPLISSESRHIQQVEKDLTLLGLREFHSQQFGKNE